MSAGAAARLDEQPFFFELAGERLFGLLHMPASASLGTVVCCHAFAEEKLWSHRVYVTFARELAAAGHAVLRFDVRGEGDSDREFEETDIETRVADTLRAIDVACDRTGSASVVLVGHRLGGSVAAAAAGQAGERVRGVVVWDPVLDGAEYFGSLLRSNMATQMATGGKVTRTREALIADMLAGETVVADGYGLHAALYRGMCALDWNARADLFRRPLRAIEVPKGGQTDPSPALKALLGAHPGSDAVLAAEPPFWRETRQFHRRAANFTAATLEWLRRPAEAA